MEKPKLYLLLLFLCLLPVGLPTSTYANNSIRVGIYQNRPLIFTDSDNRPQGIFIDVLNYIAVQEAWQISYVLCDWSSCLERLEKGELDLLVAIAYSKERTSKYDFTRETLLTNWAQVYTPRESEIQSILDLDGKTIAVLNGDTHYQVLESLLTQFNISATFFEVDDYAAVLQLVHKQTVDAGLTNRIYGAQFEADYEIYKSPIVFNPIELRFGTPKNKNQPLIQTIDSHVAQLKDDQSSVYHQSLARWLERTSQETTFPEWIIGTLIVTATLLFLFFVLSLILRTQIRRRTTELISSETRYRTLFENIPVGFISFEPDGTITAINPALLEILNSPSVEETMKLNMLSFPPLARSGVSALIRHSLDSGERVVVEHFYTSKWDKTSYLRSVFTPTRDDKGEIIGGQALVEDITALKQAEEALAGEKERLRLVVENMPVMMTAFDENWNIIVWNRECEWVTGYSAEEIIGNPKAMELLYPDDAYLRQMMEAWQTGGNDYRNWEWALTCKDGSEKIITWSNISNRFPIPGWVTWGIGVDITKQKEVEAALRDSQHSFQTLLTSITDYVWSADLMAGQVVYRYYSPVVEKITGYPPEYFMTGLEAWLSIVHPQDRPQVEQEVTLELKGHMVTHEYRIIQPDGRVKWVHGTTSPTLNQEGQVIRLDGVVSDITERKRLEEELRQAQKMEAIGRLAGGIAHDFNNMLTAIMGYAELAGTLIPPDNPGLDDIHGIQKVAERAANLTQQLLAFARRQVSEPRAFNLNDLILNVDKMLRRLIGEDIELVVLLEPDLGQVEIDPGQFEQVLVNLVVNARDAMPEGGKLTIETRNLTVDQEFFQQQPEVEPGQYVMLIVTDTGIGMNAEVKDHLFEPFFTTKEVGQGTGLGLATCFGVVKQSGGVIWVQSEAEQGTTFNICLPRIKKASTVAFDFDESDDIFPGVETILLVEDEITVRDLAGRALRQQGYTVLSAGSGTEALRIIDDQPQTEIDLLLTDVVMPHMGGVELAEQVKSLRPKTKVIYMSGYSDSTQILHRLPTSVEAFLPKPFSPDLLLRKVREVLDDRRISPLLE